MATDKPQPAGGMERQRTAYDLRHRYQWLNQFSDDELRDISFCEEDAPLQDGAQYFDVSKPERGMIIGQSGENAPKDSCFVARNTISPQTWNKLINFGRLREAGR